jgi:hypothetical protein
VGGREVGAGSGRMGVRSAKGLCSVLYSVLYVPLLQPGAVIAAAVFGFLSLIVSIHSAVLQLFLHIQQHPALAPVEQSHRVALGSDAKNADILNSTNRSTDEGRPDQRIPAKCGA